MGVSRVLGGVGDSGGHAAVAETQVPGTIRLTVGAAVSADAASEWGTEVGAEFVFASRDAAFPV